MNRPDFYSADHSATYCPEDNKLRLYVGRVPRDQYDALRAEGWQATPKQGCDFAAVWTVSRRNTALSFAGEIGDEDQSPEDRAADRAERFGDYRDKRLGEAVSFADSYDDGPAVHGCQSQTRAERAAQRHDRLAGHAVDRWSKAEYWQQRTAGVISHALHLSSPGVRMGRIKTIEAERRKAVSDFEAYASLYRLWQDVKAQAAADPDTATGLAIRLVGSTYDGRQYQHPRPSGQTPPRDRSLYSLLNDPQTPITGEEAADLWLTGRQVPAESAEETLFVRHCDLRLAYERQMLEAQGDRAAFSDLEPGGSFAGHLIRRVNKSPVTGRAVSVQVRLKDKLRVLNIERYAADAYTPPTEESRAELAAILAAEKAARPAATAPPLVNPSPEDAGRLQALLNANNPQGTPASPREMTQAEFSALSKGTYARVGTKEIHALGHIGNGTTRQRRRCGPPVCKVRIASSGGYDGTPRVIILTDKPGKPLPPALWELPVGVPTVEGMRQHLPRLAEILALPWHRRADLPKEDRELLLDGQAVGWIAIASVSQVYWTDAGQAAFASLSAAPAPTIATV